MTGPSKLPGKTSWAPPRRPMTRKAGFKATAAVRIETQLLDGYFIPSGDGLSMEFHFPRVAAGTWLGFGGWFACSSSVDVELESTAVRHVLTDYAGQNWNKFGSLWRSDGGLNWARITFHASRGEGMIATYGPLCGLVEHPHLRDAPEALLGNMWASAPEANFYVPDGQGVVTLSGDWSRRQTGSSQIVLKTCNRCGRALPVNVENEQAHLSYTNHCVAAHRRPCAHAGFGRIQDDAAGDVVQLEYGFQLECRFCKKFEVNAAHNKQRTAGQMKEDGARRRHFELLLEHLYQGTPQLRFKQQTGRDLAEYVYERFDGRCFKCGTAMASPRDMHLDHTRPLALLWPLGADATALCATHNSEKRDRPPVAYYTEEELVRLSSVTGISLVELRDPSPNIDAVARLLSDLDWFYHEFLQLDALQRVRDEKLTADLVVKALNKVLAACPAEYRTTL